ncbi:MAG: methyltransferase domain-containing protein [Leptolyngbya sp. SIOISBB]|nr:methyltransferase domain-containing protein [Leptolyngbya sp. SIOISBB]
MNGKYAILVKPLLLVVSKFRVLKLLSSKQPIRLDLGCGSIKREGFIGIDLSSRSDLPWNIEWGIPFPDNSIAEIRSDHFLEHLDLVQVIATLKECKRVLIPGGILDFSVPHLDPYIEAYCQKDFEWLEEKIPDIPIGQEKIYSTCLDRLGWLLIRSGEHKSVFDKESVIQKVQLAGFTDVKIREFATSRDQNFRFSSIYVVARK